MSNISTEDMAWLQANEITPEKIIREINYCFELIDLSLEQYAALCALARRTFPDGIALRPALSLKPLFATFASMCRSVGVTPLKYIGYTFVNRNRCREHRKLFGPDNLMLPAAKTLTDADDITEAAVVNWKTVYELTRILGAYNDMGIHARDLTEELARVGQSLTGTLAGPASRASVVSGAKATILDGERRVRSTYYAAAAGSRAEQDAYADALFSAVASREDRRSLFLQLKKEMPAHL